MYHSFILSLSKFIGTGKTTVARILSDILAFLGIREDNFSETSGQKLLGDGSKKFDDLLKKVIPGILFIDEVYQLDPKSNQVYEVLSTFLKEHFNAETPAPAGGSKSAKKRFKTQKRGKDKSASKSVRRRRRKGTKKPKSNKKRATKRSRK
jgi:hypothetical protein